MLNPRIAKIQDNQLVLIESKKNYNIHDIAFIEIVKEDIKFRKYIFLSLSIVNVVFYFNSKSDFFLNVFLVSVLISVFIFKINPSRYHLFLTFKQYKYVKIPLQKKQLKEAENLINEYKIQYQIIDQLYLSINQRNQTI